LALESQWGGISGTDSSDRVAVCTLSYESDFTDLFVRQEKLVAFS
jgi:hypothetical protein